MALRNLKPYCNNQFKLLYLSLVEGLESTYKLANWECTDWSVNSTSPEFKPDSLLSYLCRSWDDSDLLVKNSKFTNEPNSVILSSRKQNIGQIRSIRLWRLHIKIIITILKNNHGLVFFIEYNISETGVCPCFQVEPIQLVLIDRASLCFHMQKSAPETLFYIKEQDNGWRPELRELLVSESNHLREAVFSLSPNAASPPLRTNNIQSILNSLMI
jgi:hypothetical protein